MEGRAAWRGRDEVRSLLTNLLLQAPRRRSGPLFSWAVEFMPEIAEWFGEFPVVGVATTPAEEPLVVTILTRERPIDADVLSERLGLEAPIRTVVSGEIRPAARPAMGGDSISGDGAGSDTGTLTCLVRNPVGDHLVLGCNHTLAGVNQSFIDRDVVLQPGAADGGRPESDALGTLVNYQPIQLGGYFPNVMDAAIAEPHSPTSVDPGIRSLGSIRGLSPLLSHRVRLQKLGWQTGHTLGTYQLDTSYTVTFPGVGDALFIKQYGVIGDDAQKGFAQQGDSGAAVLTEDNELTGLITGVVDKLNLALVSPIQPILDAFDVTPVT